MIFTLISSFLIAVLSGMGVGGGGLFVVFLALFTDTPQITAQGINLLFFIFSSGSAVCIHLSKRQILGTAVLTMAAFGVAGAILGSLLSSVINEAILRKLFGIMLVISGIFSLMRESSPKKAERS
ncbi:MAG: sulfite exporter TauE/SafE family protein [Clostridia bacterium]|nr:sulfite exporter TauE/SafE family protein [Clostridia bacterium]